MLGTTVVTASRIPARASWRQRLVIMASLPRKRTAPGPSPAPGPVRRCFPLDDGDRPAGRAGRALDAEWSHHVHELVDPLLADLGEVHVLVEEDAVLGDELLVAREGPVGIGSRHHLDGPRVSPRHAALLL